MVWVCELAETWCDFCWVVYDALWLVYLTVCTTLWRIAGSGVWAGPVGVGWGVAPCFLLGGVQMNATECRGLNKPVKLHTYAITVYVKLNGVLEYYSTVKIPIPFRSL